jgi:hypothetical protein
MRALVTVCAAVALLPLWLRPRTPSPSEPERVERFGDGRHEWSVRRIAEPSRRVHPAEECYRATGWQVRPLPMRIAPARDTGVLSGALRWGCFEATRGAERTEVCETIVDSGGRSWSDGGSWWWSTLVGRDEGPWLGVVMVTR